MRRRPQRPESGAVGLHVVLLVAVAAAVVLVVAASAGSVLVAAGRAQDAADAAAVAAARAGMEAGSPRAAATSAASSHGATVVACACSGPQVRVTVAVPVAAPAARALGITERRAAADASLLDVSDRHARHSESTVHQCAECRWTADTTVGGRLRGRAGTLAVVTRLFRRTIMV